MAYELRELKSTDMGPICQIIKQIGVGKFGKCFNIKEVNGKAQFEAGTEVMFEIVGVVMGNFEHAQSTIDKFISSVAGISTEEIKEMEFGEYSGLLVDVMKMKGFSDFFGHAMRLFNQ